MQPKVEPRFIGNPLRGQLNPKYVPTDADRAQSVAEKATKLANDAPRSNIENDNAKLLNNQYIIKGSSAVIVTRMVGNHHANISAAKSFDIKDKLKASGYKFGNGSWDKKVPLADLHTELSKVGATIPDRLQPAN